MQEKQVNDGNRTQNNLSLMQFKGSLILEASY